MRLSAIPFFGLFFALILLTPLSASAFGVKEDNGFYLIDDPLRNPQGNDEEGSSLLAQGGYRFNEHLRLEGDLNIHRDDYRNRAPVIGSAFDRDTDGFGMMANAWYDFANETKITPYVGGGLGFNRGAPNTSSSDIATQTDTAMAWQAGGGVFYNVTKRIALTADYRLTNTDRFGFRSAPRDSLTDESDDVMSHNVRIGASYKF